MNVFTSIVLIIMWIYVIILETRLDSLNHKITMNDIDTKHKIAMLESDVNHNKNMNKIDIDHLDFMINLLFKK